jgi:hypothetical protein
MNKTENREPQENQMEALVKLEEKLERLFQRLKELKEERDLAVKQRGELEGLLRRRETQIAQLQDKLNEAETRTLNPEKEALIKNKLQNLLHKLDEF